MQCYAPGGMDIRTAETHLDCRAEAEKVGWEFYQYNASGLHFSTLKICLILGSTIGLDDLRCEHINLLTTTSGACRLPFAFDC
eukprot:g7254.t1